MIGILLCASLLVQDCPALKPRFRPAEMKMRAIHKVDIADALKQADVKGEILLDLTVGVDGSVHCVKARSGHPRLRQGVEKAVKLWKFKPLLENGRPVVHIGQLHFVLCNISCGDRGASMTLLRN